MQTGMGRVVGMRAEDRKPAKRVFPLLQNLDLDTVTFSQVQSVGEPISIEDMNEQELQDLVLVNLARLSVESEWTGLLEAGGGAGLVEVLPVIGTTDADQYNVSECPPWGGSVITSESVATIGKPTAWPFIAPTTGTVSAIGINVASAQASKNVYVAIYSQDSNFLPSTRLGYATIALDSTGNIYQTSISATVSLEAGSQYWYSINTDASSTATLRATHDAYIPTLGITDALDAKHFAIEDDTADVYAVPPSTFAATALDADNARMVVGLKF